MRDEITAISFDSAVMTFGVWIENKLNEHDEDGKPIHNLRDLLGIPYTKAELRAMNKVSFKMLDRAARKRSSKIKVD